MNLNEAIDQLVDYIVDEMDEWNEDTFYELLHENIDNMVTYTRDAEDIIAGNVTEALEAAKEFGSADTVEQLAYCLLDSLSGEIYERVKKLVESCECDEEVEE